MQQSAKLESKADLSISSLFAKLNTLMEEAKGEVAEVAAFALPAELLQQILTDTLGEQALVVFPENPTAPSPLALTAHPAIPYVKRLGGYKIIGETAEQKSLLTHKPLQKPLIMLLPTPGTVNSWVSCVVLPQNYQAPYGKPTGNTEGEVVFYMTAHATQKPEEMPAMFLPLYQLLTAGCSYKQREQQFVIAPVLTKAMFYNGSRQQQLESADSGRWAVYNALMIVLTGHVHFAQHFTQPNSTTAYRLRALLASLSPISVKGEKGDAKAAKVVTEIKETKEVKQEVKQEVKEEAKETKTFHDPSPALPAYTAQTIHTLLLAQDIPTAPDAKLVKDASGNFDFYTYPLQNLVPTLLLQDNIAYFLGQGTSAGNRRACFLLADAEHKPLALIVQLFDWNPQHAEALRKLLRDEKLETVESILKAPLVARHFKQLYRQTHCLFLGGTANPALVEQLKTPIQQAYAGAVRLDFMALPALNTSIVLAEHITTMLKSGKTADLVSLDVMKSHKKQGVAAFLTALEKIKSQDAKCHAKITDNLKILFKYLALTLQRASRHGIKGNKLEDLELLLAFDKHVKANIYRQTFDNLKLCLDQLDLEPLIQLLVVKDQPEKLLQKLQASQQKQLQSIQAWEADINQQFAELNKRWLPYLWRKSKATATYVYHNSFVYLGSGLVRWIGQPVVEAAQGNRLVQGAKSLVKKLTKATAYGLTLSPRVADRAQQSVEQFFRRENIPRLLSFTGAGLGLAYSYSLGFYVLARMLGVSTFAIKISDYMRQEQLDDARAIVIPPTRSLSAAQCIRATSLALTAFETAYTRNYQHLVSAMGGIGGSLTATRIGQRYVPELQVTPGQPLTEDQAFSLFLLSAGGHDIGYSLTSFGLATWTTIVTKLQARNRVITELHVRSDRGELPDLEVVPPHMLTHPRLWFNNDNPLKLVWRSRDGFFQHSDCQIQTFDYPMVRDDLTCTTPITSAPRIKSP